MVEPQTAPTEPKLSRYRSVRKAAQQTSSAQPIVQETQSSANTANAVNRSRSRYHRPRTAVTDHPPDFVTKANQQFGTTTLIVGNAGPANTTRLRDAPDPTEEAKERARRAIAREAERQQKVKDDARADRQARPFVEKAWRVNEVELEPQPDQTKLALRQNEERKLRAQKRQDAAIARHQHSQPPATKDRKLISASDSAEDQGPTFSHPSGEKGNARPQLTSQRRQQSEPVRRLHHEPSRENGSSKGLFGFLKRHKSSDASSKLPTPAASATPTKSNLSVHKEEEPQPENIEPGGGGVVPGIDAPRTAINAGERRVLVECSHSSIQLPVTPETTPSDLVWSAANCLSEPINPKASVLLESFSKVGVQRRLRMYEHVRDVMNSWDSDTQNTLLLVESASGGVDPDLTSATVPLQQPTGGSFAMYYSQKPGKWDKRWVTLTEDGQIHLAKIGSSKKETTNVCHLSDFDIYTPTRKQMSKKVKPPKKHCFAVKSQQKSGIFMSTTNFVHFFATGDRETGAEFYRKVHGWRSWYLINVMGEGKRTRKESSPTKPATGVQANAQIPNTGRRMSLSRDQGHNRQISEESHCQIGTFKPLIDPASLDPKLDANAPLPKSFHARRTSHDIQPSPETKHAYQRNMSLRTRTNPPVSFPRKLQKDDANRPTTAQPPPAATTPSTDAAFAPASLLGRTYSQRQAQQREREVQQQSSGPFTAGPSLVNGGLDQPATNEFNSGIKRSPSTRTTNDNRTNSLVHRSTRRQPPKPLVDLTPTYREPPQHARKGRGYHPDQVGPGGLVENATSPEDPIAAPSATDWRGRNGGPPSAGLPSAGLSGGGSGRRGSVSMVGGGTAAGAGAGEPPLSARSMSFRIGTAPLHQSNATPRRASGEQFAPDGLVGQLAAAGSGGWGANATGRGVMDGTKAKGPLLDMNEESKFAKGSLLSGVPDREKAVERGRREEVLVGVGEAM